MSFNLLCMVSKNVLTEKQSKIFTKAFFKGLAKLILFLTLQPKCFMKGKCEARKPKTISKKNPKKHFTKQSIQNH